MTPRLAAVTTVREEADLVGVRTAPDVVDGVRGDTATAKLNADQRREIAVRLRACAVDDWIVTSGAFHFGGYLFADLEGSDADVRADRHDELGWIVSERLDRSRHDPRDGTAPTCVHGRSMSAWWVPNQDRDAIRGAGCDSAFCDADDQPISLGVCNRFRAIAERDHANHGSMDLSLFEKAITRETDRAQEAFAVFADGVFIVANVIPEVQCIARRTAHPPKTCCETVSKAMLIQKGRTQSTHTMLHTMTTLHEPQVRAKRNPFVT